jgi:5-methylcytosine-specific restriction endonuclease McrA
MNYKTCTGDCKRTLLATTEFFHKQKAGKFGLRATCKVCHAEYRENNKERDVIRVAKWQKNNREKYMVYNAKWQRDNSDKCNAYKAKRRAKKLNQTPDLTQEEKHQIELIYKKSQELGQDWQVDHIIPLSKGGLHHPDNLQVVTKRYNLEKRAKLNFRLPTNKEIFTMSGG